MQLLMLVAALSAASTSLADFVLYDQRIPFDKLPYQVDTTTGGRGPQAGYNICNSTTEGPNSLCQTAFVNTPDDWCFWAPIDPNSVVGNVEGEMVAWCTKKGHGTRVIPQGAITGMSWIRTSNYIQITGAIKQQMINLDPNDSGGEMDPHGADLRGNPKGGMMYSTAFNTAGNIEQTPDWTSFMGSNQFCMTVCNPSSPVDQSRQYCNNIYDLLGCDYNAPGNYNAGVFEDCKGDLKDPVGIYTGADGHVSTYFQPENGVITDIPYNPRTPASSECSTFTSAQLFSDASVTTTTAPSSTIRTTSTGSMTKTTSSLTSAVSTSGSNPTRTGTQSTGSQTPVGAQSSQTSNGANTHIVTVWFGLFSAMMAGVIVL